MAKKVKKVRKIKIFPVILFLLIGAFYTLL